MHFLSILNLAKSYVDLDRYDFTCAKVRPLALRFWSKHTDTQTLKPSITTRSYLSALLHTI